MSSMEQTPDLSSGKGHKDENFPVASFIIKPRHRAVVMAFYRFARKGDDIADHPVEAPETKLALLERMRATLAGETDADPEALALRQQQAVRGLNGEHGLDLLEAFRRDVTKTRYADWGELIDYCRWSAMPVGRFVLDVHVEDRALWPANDALCAALQVINHLQDCAKDHAALDRVYLPQDALVAGDCTVEDLAAPKASPALRAVIAGLAERAWTLLDQSRPFAAGIKDARLAYEVAAIQRLAEDLTRKLMYLDPLSERVHHTRLETLGLLALAAMDRLVGPRQSCARRMTQSPEIAAAEAKAKSSSFYAGMRVLPEAERAAMFAIYAFCRAVDDIVDEPGIDPDLRRRELDAWRADLAELYDGGAGGRSAFLKPAVQRFGLVQADFQAVIDGMQMDADADIRAPNLATLDLYCDRVASAVGRLSVRVFGMEDAAGETLAYHLGRALQLTNIIRDIDEDAGIGRLYLAREWLDAAGIAGDDPAAVVADPRIDVAARQGAALAHQHFAVADRVIAARPKGRLVAPRLMSAVYGAILMRMEQEGWASPRIRVKLGKGELLAIVLRRLVLGR